MNKLLLVVPLMMLAACDNSPKVEAENASIEEVAGKVREANAGSTTIVRPGQWESSVELESIEVPGMPADAVAQMKKTMARVATGHKSCLTPEQAETPNADFLTAQKGSNWTYSGFEMAGGTIKGNVSCTGGQGGNATVAMKGIYTPASYTMTMDVTSAGMGGPQAQDMKMHMKMKTSSKRVGECPSSPTP